MAAHRLREDLVFLTASWPTLKQLNRALAILTDYDFNNGLDNFSWVLARRKALDQASIALDAASTRVPLPADTLAVHDFAGWSMRQIADAVVANDAKITAAGPLAHLWLVLDQRGLDTDTVLLVERMFDEDKNAAGDANHATRLPMEFARETYANLICTVDYEDYVDVGDDCIDEPGVFKFTLENETDSPEGRRRDEQLRKLREDGVID